MCIVKIKEHEDDSSKNKDFVVFSELKDDRTFGKFLYVNDVFSKQLGYTENELINMSIYDITSQNERENIKNIANQLLEQKQVNLEISIVSKEGQRTEIEVNGHILDADGMNTCIWIGNDVTERELTRKALKESEEKYFKLIELLPDAVHIKHNSTIVYSNEAGAKLYGFKDLKEVIGRDDKEFTHPDYLNISRKRGEKVVFEGEKASLTEGKIIRIDGQIVDVEVASTSIECGGEKFILSVIRDVTERNKSEEAMQGMINENKRLLKKAIESENLKTEIFTNISHEFRTPLNVILGSVQLLTMRLNDEGNVIDRTLYNKYMSIIKQNCYRLLRLINNLIDISKNDSGYLELNAKNNDIINVVEDITLSVAEYAKNKGITIIFDTEVEEKIMAFDEEKIERIMLNLLSNAIKYSKGKGKIFVNVYERSESVVIAVKDTGIGIPKGKTQNIFQRFIQLDKSLHGANEGSGIGLALTKMLVEKHGGKIWVESNYGEGSEFFIKLPVKVLKEKSTQMTGSFANESLLEKVNIEFSDI